jgi:hypothetical protein
LSTPKLNQAASQTLPMPATKVPTKIANKVIVSPQVADHPKTNRPEGRFFSALAPKGSYQIL